MRHLLGGGDSPFIRPNVSRCIQENEVHYNPIPETRLIIKYNVTDDTQTTQIYGGHYDWEKEKYVVNGAKLYNNIEIDGVDAVITEIDEASGKYQLTSGEHTIKYTLKNQTNIDDYAFADCATITSVNIPSSVTNIGTYAFSSCYNLINIVIPNNVTVISDGLFNSCSSLTNLIIPENVTSIGMYAFQLCSSLTSVTIPNGVTTIDIGTFQFCSNLTSVYIPNSVTSVNTFAFSNCSHITSIVIPNNVTSIGPNAFENCSSLASITSNADTAPSIDIYTFNNVNTGGTLYVPQGSTGYDVWMGTGDYYLGKYGWTKVEQ